MKITRLGLAVILILIFAVGCSSKNDIDPILLGKNDCLPPCWNSIIPGQTTMAEASKIIENDGEKIKYSSDDMNLYVDYRDRHVSLHFYNDQIVESIAFDLERTHLDQIIEVFGEPEFLEFQFSGGGVTNIFYPTRGLYFLGPGKRNITHEKWVISRNTNLTYTVFTKANINGQDDEWFGMLFGDGVSIKQRIIPWQGYKNYPLNP
jgi:hypothetical protein